MLKFQKMLLCVDFLNHISPPPSLNYNALRIIISKKKKTKARKIYSKIKIFLQRNPYAYSLYASDWLICNFNNPTKGVYYGKTK